MLIEINNQDELGKINEIVYVLKGIFLNKIPISMQDLNSYCMSRRMPLKGILTFLRTTGFIEEIGTMIQLKSSFSEIEFDFEKMNTIIIKRVMNALNEELDNDFIDFRKVKFDVSIGAYISNENIPLKYSGLRNLLIEAGFFKTSDIADGILIIDELYIYELQKMISSNKKRMSLEQLKRKIEYQNEVGFEAELFVLAYEKRRLNGVANDVKCISNIDVTAGYDIVSFNTEKSLSYDRFIEVKSYSGKVSFYWSKNEIEVAKLKQENYFLYLVNRDEMRRKEYAPKVIKNPYKEIFLGERWMKDPQSWFVCESI